MTSINMLSVWLLTVTMVTMSGFHGYEALETNSQMHTLRLLYMEEELISISESVLNLDEHYDDVIEKEEGGERDVHNFKHVHEFLEKTKKLNEEALNNIENVSGDVVQILQLKMRLNNEWTPIFELIEESEVLIKYKAFASKIRSIKQVLKREASVEDAMGDIVRLIDVYKSPVSDLASGKLGHSSVTPLRPLDTIQMATYAEERGRNKMALDMISAGLTMNSTEDIKHMKNIKGTLLMKSGHFNEAEQLFEELSKENPSSRSYQSSLKMIQLKRNETPAEKRQMRGQKQLDEETIEEERRMNETEILWKALCRDEVAMAGSDTLRCHESRFKELNRPVFIEPIIKDKLVIIKNLFSDAEMDYIRSAAHERVLSEMINDRIYMYGDASLYALTRVDWVQKYHSSLINLTFADSNIKHMECIPGFLMKNHGPGGKAKPLIKQKYLKYSNKWDALAIGNYYLFLNDVEEGGGLAFPSLRLKIKPEKGTLVYWKFRNQKGPIDWRFKEYVECPVIRGNSWTSVNLIEHYGMIEKLHFLPQTLRTYEEMPGELTFRLDDLYTGIPRPINKIRKRRKKKSKKTKKVRDEDVVEGEDEMDEEKKEEEQIQDDDEKEASDDEVVDIVMEDDGDDSNDDQEKVDDIEEEDDEDKEDKHDEDEVKEINIIDDDEEEEIVAADENLIEITPDDEKNDEEDEDDIEVEDVED